MTNNEMNTIQILYNKVIDGTMRGFDSRFISAVIKHNSKYTLSLWEIATLKRIADKYGTTYTPEKPLEMPVMTIHYIVNTNEMPIEAWGYELTEKYDIGEIQEKAKMFVEEVMMGGQDEMPIECWVRRNEVFFCNNRSEQK